MLQLEERLGFLLSAAACQYLLPVRNKSQFPEKYSEILHSTLLVLARVLQANDSLQPVATHPEHPVSYWNSTVLTKPVNVSIKLSLYWTLSIWQSIYLVKKASVSYPGCSYPVSTACVSCELLCIKWNESLYWQTLNKAWVWANSTRSEWIGSATRSAVATLLLFYPC